MREIEIEILRFFTNLQQPVLDQIAWVLTFLGDETFYFIILPFVFWCVSKGFGIRLLYVFVVSVYVNAWLKTLFAVTRPVGYEGLGINSLYVESAEVGSRFPHDSFPSGHAQGSTTLWGYIAYRVNQPITWIIALVLILLISIARVYTGVHWPSDIIGGIAIAIIIITVCHFVEKFLQSITDGGKIVLAVVLPIVMVFLFTDPEGFSYSGFLLGAGIGYFVEKHYVRMAIPVSWFKRIIAYIIGILVLFGLQTGLKEILPDLAIYDGLRYMILGLWGLWFAPWVFVKIGLYERDRGY
ncbi:phosphatase PAP2 family protein [Evansella sp. AB-P1]|uniref:phosphatase PAP2 family protein n=1 Tax=Evansella sp. AB-P1 TaxID=3037653 RepID=UPI00241C4190|nr:phosphatase PAP2 family protein [Evansella sp. AB-P1]MDG5789210.1 phosphatase PAP2 family protein [Evansella sp. AB-P1]